MPGHHPRSRPTPTIKSGCFLVGFPRRKTKGELLGTSDLLRKCLPEKPGKERREQDQKREEAKSVISDVASAWSQEGSEQRWQLSHSIWGQVS